MLIPYSFLSYRLGRNQLSNFIDLPLLTHEWETVLQVVQIARVGNFNLQEVTLPSFLGHLADVALKLIWVLHPFQPINGKVSTNRPTIQVICIQALKADSLTLWEDHGECQEA